jgi:hypothetical protein
MIDEGDTALGSTDSRKAADELAMNASSATFEFKIWIRPSPSAARRRTARGRAAFLIAPFSISSGGIPRCNGFEVAA